MKTLIKIMAVLTALAAAAAVVYHFRDKLREFFPCCKEEESDFEPFCEAPAEAHCEPVQQTPAEETKEEPEAPQSDVKPEDFAD